MALKKITKANSDINFSLKQTKKYKKNP